MTDMNAIQGSEFDLSRFCGLYWVGDKGRKKGGKRSLGIMTPQQRSEQPKNPSIAALAVTNASAERGWPLNG
jgi:hypothetical protein